MTAAATKKPLVLIDGSSYLYRAFHALPPLSNSRGEPTGAIYGVINMIRKLLADYQPDYMAVVFDAKGRTFRDHMYPKYKANRPPMPDELRAQIKPLHNIIKAMGLPLLIIDGVEADDVIGTLAIQAKQQQMPTLISTGDKDMTQLVNSDITLINTMTGTVLDQAGVEKKFGVPPEKIIDYLTLMGDSVDNIPGVPKVGPKTAVKWLQQYGTLDEIINHADEITGKVGENLRASLKQLPLSRQLVTIKLDIAMEKGPQDLVPQPADEKSLIDLFKQLEFKTWLAEALGKQQGKPETKSGHVTILTEQDFKQWLQQLEQAEAFSFDTETTSLNSRAAQLVGVSFAIETGKAAYVPVAHNYEGAPKQLTCQWVLQQLKPLLQNSKKILIGQNLKYDMNVLLNYDLEITAKRYDTMLESYVLNSSSSRHDMDTLALKYLGKNTIHFEDIAGKGAKQLSFNQIPLQQAGPYAAEDADITLQLHQNLWPKLAADKKLAAVFSTIEMPVMPVLAHMERHGVLVDAKLLKSLSHEFGKRIVQLQQEVHKQAGEEFNLGSPKQLQEIFYHKLKLPILRKTPTGQPSTAENVLQELALDYPLPKLILEFRSLSKLKSTYTDRLQEQIDAHSGRVHTSYNQAVAATGRLSSTDPNLQNIPIRTEEGRRIRQAFIAPPGYKIISADYSQVELRIMAHLTQDKSLLKAFADGLDIHRATASEVFGVAVTKVTPEQRRSAKAINFGLIYGMSAFGLARQLGIERKVAQQYMDLYFARYPGMKNYMDSTRKLAHKQGYVETLYGRRLYLPEINASNLQRRMAAERAAINAPMQGTAADIIKLAMINLHAALRKSKLDAVMIMQVHDELVFEVAKKDVKAATETIRSHMTNAVKLKVSLVVEIGVGNNWDEAH